MATVVIDWDDVKEVAKSQADQFDTISAGFQTEYMEKAAIRASVKTAFMCSAFIRFVGQDAYDSYIKEMQAYWAAHLAANSFVLAAGEGAEVSESIGGVSQSRNQPVNNPQADQGHLETVYGRHFEVLLNDFKELLEEAKKRSSVGFGLYSNGALKGFPVVVPSC